MPDGKFRLCDAAGNMHDCRAFHEAKRSNNGRATPPNNLLREIIAWSKRWGHNMPINALAELDDILDTNASPR